MDRTLVAVTGLFLVALLAACGGASDPSSAECQGAECADTGSDIVSDAAPDAVPDAEPDAVPDTQPDALPDVQPDVADAAQDAAMDTGGMDSGGMDEDAPNDADGGDEVLRGELELCDSDTHCIEGLFCHAMTPGGVTRCTRQCNTRAECPADMLCNFGRCVENDTGTFCEDAEQCNQFCVAQNSYCTHRCGHGGDCPAGYGCMLLRDPAIRVCVRTEAYCSVEDQSECLDPALCDLSPTLLIGGCTIPCDTAADCPRRGAGPGWTCNGVCRRPPDVYGSLPGGYSPVEYYCNQSDEVVPLCNDAQHMNFESFTIPDPPDLTCGGITTTPGSEGDSCVNTCRHHEGCAHGYACVAVGAAPQQRIGLCLPTGQVETGSSCTRNTECVSGYCYNDTCSRDCTVDGICPGGLRCVEGGGPNVEGQPFRRCE